MFPPILFNVFNKKFVKTSVEELVKFPDASNIPAIPFILFLPKEVFLSVTLFEESVVVLKNSVDVFEL